MARDSGQHRDLDVVTSPRIASLTAGVCGVAISVVAWAIQGVGLAIGALAFTTIVALVALRLSPRVSYEFGAGAIHVLVDNERTEWPLDSFVSAKIIVASRGSDSFSLMTRDHRELLVPVTAEATLRAAAPQLLRMSTLAIAIDARRFLLDITRT